MQGTMIYGPHDIRFEGRPEPAIVQPTDAIIIDGHVVGDGSAGPLAVLSAKQIGAERIIAMSRHESR